MGGWLWGGLTLFPSTFQKKIFSTFWDIQTDRFCLASEKNSKKMKSLGKLFFEGNKF